MAFTISSTVLLGIRIAQGIFALIVLGTMGHVAAWWNSNWRATSPSEINFLIFTAVWTLLALAYLIVVPMHFSNSVAHHKFAILAIESITTVFWFAGFIATAVWLNGRVCYGEVCRSATAGDVFSAFEWLLFAATATFAVLHVTNSRNTIAPTKHVGDHGVSVQEGV